MATFLMSSRTVDDGPVTPGATATGTVERDGWVMGRALSHVDRPSENQPMDGLAWLALACLAVGVLVRALVPAMAPGMQAHVAALGQLLGGWRPPPWPRGVQEDDPEVAWAKHGAGRAASQSGVQPAAASIEDLD